MWNPEALEAWDAGAENIIITSKRQYAATIEVRRKTLVSERTALRAPQTYPHKMEKHVTPLWQHLGARRLQLFEPFPTERIQKQRERTIWQRQNSRT